MAFLRIGHLSTFYHTSILLLAKGNAAKIPGLDIEWKLFGTGPDIVKAFSRNQLDLAYVGLPPAIIGIDRGLEIRCVAGGHIEGTVISGKDIIKGFPDLDGLDEVLDQLRGLNIGVPGKGSIHDVILKDCLDRFGLRDHVGVVNYPLADLIIDAIVRGEVVAAAGTPALATALKRYASCEILCPPSKLYPYNPSYGIIADTKFIRSKREFVEKFLKIHEETTSFIRHHPEEASEIISAYVGLVDKEFVMDTIAISPKYCAQLTDDYINSTMEFVDILRRLGYIKNVISADRIFDTSLIRKIHPPGDHYGEGIYTRQSTSFF